MIGEATAAGLDLDRWSAEREHTAGATERGGTRSENARKCDEGLVADMARIDCADLHVVQVFADSLRRVREPKVSRETSRHVRALEAALSPERRKKQRPGAAAALQRPFGFADSLASLQLKENLLVVERHRRGGEEGLDRLRETLALVGVACSRIAPTSGRRPPCQSAMNAASNVCVSVIALVP